MRCALVLMLSLVALSVGACGGDDDEGGSGSGSSKEEFIEAADEICREANRDFEEINNDLDAITGSVSEQLTQAEPILREGAELVNERIDEFEALDPPPDDAETIDRFLEAVEQQRAHLEQMAEAAAAGEVEEFRQATEGLQQVAAERREIVQGYGFRVCGTR